MTAILKREMSAYFASPLGYVFIAVFWFFSGAFFYMFTLTAKTADLSNVFIGMFFIMIIFIPVLTMRLLSDDKRQKTDQLILTAPVSLMRIVLGKFLAAFAVFLIGVAMILIYGVALSFFASVNWAMILGNVTGMILMGAVYIAVGVFVSSLTENQMIAAVGAIGVNLVTLLLDTLASVMPVKFMQEALSALSFYNRYYEFTLGIFSLGNILYFVSVIFIFLFLTVRVLEKRRWA